MMKSYFATHGCSRVLRSTADSRETIWKLIENHKIFKIASVHFSASYFRRWAVETAREARRIRFHLSWYLSDPVVPSYVRFCVFQTHEFREY